MKRPEGRSALLANWRQQPDRATTLQRDAWLAGHCWRPDLHIVDRHHLSTGYLAVGTVRPR